MSPGRQTTVPPQPLSGIKQFPTEEIAVIGIEDVMTETGIEEGVVEMIMMTIITIMTMTTMTTDIIN